MSEENSAKAPRGENSSEGGGGRSRRRRGRRRGRPPGPSGAASAEGAPNKQTGAGGQAGETRSAEPRPADGPAGEGRRSRRRRPRGKGPAAGDNQQGSADQAKPAEGTPKRRRRNRKRSTDAERPPRRRPESGEPQSREGRPRDQSAADRPRRERTQRREATSEHAPKAPVSEPLPPIEVPPPTVPDTSVDPDGDDVFHLLGQENGLELDEGTSGQLFNVAPVTIRGTPLLPCDAGELDLKKGDRVLVETDRGMTVGMVLDRPARKMASPPLPKLLSHIDEDNQRLDRAIKQEQEAFAFCRQRIRERQLPMKLVHVELLHSGNKALFYFSAENRVDFRDLVKDLARKLHARIEMRQIGVRDESRMSGGIGPCGQKLCCSTWIKDFQPVSIRMAKDQNLVLNPTKVSGMCGRLKCCLSYEQQLYRAARANLPKVGQRVQTPAGQARVHELDIPRQLVRVLCQDGTFSTFPAADVHKEA